MKISYLGPDGSFTHTVVQSVFPNEKKVPYRNISACLQAVVDGKVSAAIVPIENTAEGIVNQTSDFLFLQKELFISAEFIFPIQQQFMVNTAYLSEWKNCEKIVSHPQAIAQSQMFLQKYFANIPIKLTESTSAAAEYIANHSDICLGAIAPKKAAEMYHLEIVQKNVQDLVSNQTSFWVIQRKDLPQLQMHFPNFKKKMSIYLTLPNNLPGALYKVLGAFNWRSIDLSRIESRPLKTVLGEYFFLIDIVANQPEELIFLALEEIQLLGASVRFLGTYPIYIVSKS